MPQSGYDAIAKEYYSPEHITSRNFDKATKLALQQLPFSHSDLDGKVLELGAGRGRVKEFLEIDASRVVQLDSSAAMLDLDEREPCLLKVHCDACKIPFASQQFAFVVGFLVDPFMGLDCLAEAYRMLQTNGRMLLTVPTKQWGDSIRSILQVDRMSTRFKFIGTEKTVVLPSVLHSPERIHEMLEMTGFRDIKIANHMSSEDEQRVSADIMNVCRSLNIPLTELPIIHTVSAQR